MAIVSVTELSSPVATHDFRGRRYTKVFHVRTSSTNDRESTVINATGIPDFGDTWAAGSDTDTAAKLRSKTAERYEPEGDRLNWRVVCEFHTTLDVAGWPADGEWPTYGP